ncbi:MAG: hypothetical protein PVG74_05630, partial [Desulfobacterales bacterium]
QRRRPFESLKINRYTQRHNYEFIYHYIEGAVIQIQVNRRKRCGCVRQDLSRFVYHPNPSSV